MVAPVSVVPSEDPRAYDPRADEPQGLSLRDMARLAGLEADGWTYDTSMPMQWMDAVKDMTGIWPFGRGIVWAYGPSGSGYFYGDAFALTSEGAMLLDIVKHITSRERQ